MQTKEAQGRSLGINRDDRRVSKDKLAGSKDGKTGNTQQQQGGRVKSRATHTRKRAHTHTHKAHLCDSALKTQGNMTARKAERREEK